jgi:hypothetical protein
VCPVSEQMSRRQVYAFVALADLPPLECVLFTGGDGLHVAVGDNVDFIIGQYPRSVPLFYILLHLNFLRQPMIGIRKVVVIPRPSIFNGT